MPASSVRSRTPRLRTPSLGVEAWAISTAGCVSMDDMQLLYFGQHLESSREQVGVPLGLFKSPLFARVFPNTFQVTLGGGREPVFSHARGVACA